MDGLQRKSSSGSPVSKHSQPFSRSGLSENSHEPPVLSRTTLDPLATSVSLSVVHEKRVMECVRMTLKEVSFSAREVAVLFYAVPPGYQPKK